MKGHERGDDEDASEQAWADNPNFIRDERSDNIEQDVLFAAVQARRGENRHR